jgi:hypothetical protein
LDQPTYESLPEPIDEENDMLDLAFGLTHTYEVQSILFVLYSLVVFFGFEMQVFVTHSVVLVSAAKFISPKRSMASLSRCPGRRGTLLWMDTLRSHTETSRALRISWLE